MPYLSDYNILYINAARIEETRIQDYFRRNLKLVVDMEEPCTLQMFRAAMKINAYTFIFGSVRNPYIRTIHDLYARNVINSEMSHEEVEGLLLAFLTQYDPAKNPNHTTPQYMYFTKDDEMDPNVKVVKHETLEQDMIAIGFDNFKARPTRTDSYDQLTLKSVLAINHLYAKDFEHFGYEPITTQEQLDALYTSARKSRTEPLQTVPLPVPPQTVPLQTVPLQTVPPQVLRSAPTRLKTPSLWLNFYR